jgi:mannose-1-phosphate guanylyltransferase
VINPKVLSFIPSHKPLSLEKEIFPVLAEKGELYAYKHKGYWADIGVPRDYERVCKDFFEGKLVL